MELKLSQVRTIERNNRGGKESQGISESKLPLKKKKKHGPKSIEEDPLGG